MESSLKFWKAEGYSAVWLPINIEHSHLVKQAVQDFGFELHHTNKNQIILSKWLVEAYPSKLPTFSTHNLGVGGIVLNP